MKKIDSDEIIKMRKDGFTYSQICEKTKLAKSTISKYCSGINENFAIYEKIRKIDDVAISEAQKIYDDGYSLREVSKIVKISRQALAKYLKIRNRKTRTDNELKIIKSSNTKKWKRDFRNELIENRGGKCVVCGYNKSIRALHFHHLNPDTKDFRISIGSVSKELVLKEIEKCILVCSNCHCEIHDEMYENNGISQIINELNKS